MSEPQVPTVAPVSAQIWPAGHCESAVQTREAVSGTETAGWVRSLLAKSSVPVRVSGVASPLRSSNSTGIDWLPPGAIENALAWPATRLKSASVPLARAMEEIAHASVPWSVRLTDRVAEPPTVTVPKSIAAGERARLQLGTNAESATLSWGVARLEVERVSVPLRAKGAVLWATSKSTAIVAWPPGGTEKLVACEAGTKKPGSLAEAMAMADTEQVNLPTEVRATAAVDGVPRVAVPKSTLVGESCSRQLGAVAESGTETVGCVRSLLSNVRVPVRTSGGAAPLRSLNSTGMASLPPGGIESALAWPAARLKSGSVPLARRIDEIAHASVPWLVSVTDWLSGPPTPTLPKLIDEGDTARLQLGTTAERATVNWGASRSELVIVSVPWRAKGSALCATSKSTVIAAWLPGGPRSSWLATREPRSRGRCLARWQCRTPSN